MTDLKNSTEKFNSRLDKQKKASINNSKTDHLKLSSQRNKKKKN